LRFILLEDFLLLLLFFFFLLLFRKLFGLGLCVGLFLFGIIDNRVHIRDLSGFDIDLFILVLLLQAPEPVKVIESAMLFKGSILEDKNIVCAHDCLNTVGD
jgi:hypothetical protein